MLAKVGNRVTMLRERLETCKVELRKLQAEEPQAEEDSEFRTGEMEKLKIQTETTLSQAIQEQKSVFIAVLQVRFARCAEELWFYWAEGWFREIGRCYYAVIADFVWTFENVMLTPDLDARVHAMFADIRSFIDARKATVLPAPAAAATLVAADAPDAPAGAA
ncbi:MAG: hypothetical protein BJ554DRAFT_2666 [Olpidium bornovanus]|uniref:Uncharacterized protein n=1 Tax=Olpidium bornovanus TaxID=278681 RepID=A0A8H7ZQ60_9FUNG|nr:MAG: hypothetical protein BJ554DRAFT_2666 [Olpidium bornovanus]